MPEPRPVTCRYCGARIESRPGLRTGKSAWSAPDTADPLDCPVPGPGHAPAPPPRGRTLRPGY